METSEKVCIINPPKDGKLCAKISSTGKSKKQVGNMEKDFHLLQAALATDQVIISCDKTVQKLFKQASQQIDEIQQIIWVNPDRAEDQPITWLQNGAPPEAHRQLST